MQNLVFDPQVLMKRGTFYWHSDLRMALHNVGYEVYFSKHFPSNGRRRCFLTAPTEEFPNKDVGKGIAKFSPPEPYNELAEDYKRDIRAFYQNLVMSLDKAASHIPKNLFNSIQTIPNQIETYLTTKG